MLRIAIVYIGELFSGMEIASMKHVLKHIGLTILETKIIKLKLSKEYKYNYKYEK